MDFSGVCLYSVAAKIKELFCFRFHSNTNESQPGLDLFHTGSIDSLNLNIDQ